MTTKAKPVALTQQELEARLLAAANSLRGPVDPADFKQYVFPLLFLKRLSDAWDAEQKEAEGDYAPSPVPIAALRDYHRFEIPETCHWGDLRKVTENTGHALQVILDRIQEANPTTLAGIFGEVAWSNKDRLPEHALLRLIDIFNGIPLSPAIVSHDMLGQAYEYLLREFAEASGKKAGEFFTPRAVVRLLTRILQPQAGDSIYDPASGSAGMLVEAVNEVKEAGQDTRTLRLYGQEVNLTTAAIARMNLFMHDIEDFRIVRGDTLRDPKFLDQNGALSQFDIVIANPPFSLRNWGAEVWATDPYKRAGCGVPPNTSADFAWVQHMVASMTPEVGRVGVVMPNGATFRGGAEAVIRECLVRGDLLEAVIALPPNLFYSTAIPACLLIFRAEKPQERRGHVLFVDGSRCFEKGRTQNLLRPTDVDGIVEAYVNGEQDLDARVPARLVPFDEIAKNKWDMNIRRYLGAEAAEALTPSEAASHLAEARTSVSAVREYLDALLRATEDRIQEAEATLVEVAAEGGFPLGSPTPIKDLLANTIGGVWGQGPGEGEMDVAVARSTEFSDEGVLDLSTAAQRAITRKQYQSRALRQGDVLLEKSGGGPKKPVGRVVLVRTEPTAPTVFSNFVQVLRPDPDKVYPLYLHWLMWGWHREGRTLEFQAATTGIHNLRVPDYLAQEVSLPPLSRQMEIADAMEAVFLIGQQVREKSDALTGLTHGLLMPLLGASHVVH